MSSSLFFLPASPSVLDFSFGSVACIFCFVGGAAVDLAGIFYLLEIDDFTFYPWLRNLSTLGVANRRFFFPLAVGWNCFPIHLISAVGVAVSFFRSNSSILCLVVSRGVCRLILVCDSGPCISEVSSFNG
jgi:hypothetical protein